MVISSVELGDKSKRSHSTLMRLSICCFASRPTEEPSLFICILNVASAVIVRFARTSTYEH